VAPPGNQAANGENKHQPKYREKPVYSTQIKERALYHRTVTGQKWADARRYHMTIDTSQIGLDKTVELILKYLELNT
jgi:hypothetical protein